MSIKIALLLILTVCLIVAWCIPIWGVPILQLYIDGATYDSDTETWITTETNFDLWVLGDVEKKGTIYEVELGFSYGLNPGVNTPITYPDNPSGHLTPTTTERIDDLSTPDAPEFLEGGFGSHPDVRKHYENTDIWETYLLRDFFLLDSPIGDFNGSFPETFPDWGQVNAYNIQLSDDIAIAYFDASGYYKDKKGKVHDVFAPYSHDAGYSYDAGSGTHTPEPTTIVLMGCGLLVLLGIGIKHRRKP